VGTTETAGRARRSAAHVWRFASCEFDELRFELRVRGAAVEIETKPLDVLHQLLLHAGEVVTKDELLETVWPGTAVVDGSLATAVSKLRKALGTDQHAIVTVPRVGYRLAGPVHATSTPRVGYEQTEQQSAERSQWWVRDYRSWLLMILALLVCVAASVGVYRWNSSKRSAAGSPASRIGSLAVLPLVNMSGDPGQEYLADGLTEALITDLSKIRALRVISRTTAMQYKNVHKPLPEIARELNVDAIVEGSVVRSGDRVRLTAQLIQAASDVHLWAETYERDLRDLLNLERELARQVSRGVRDSVRPSESEQLAGAGTVDAKALDLYLRGRYFWNRRTRDDLLRAQAYFQQATEIDPNDPLAYAGLADTYVELVGFGDVSPAEGLPKAKAAATKSIGLNESLAEPHAALAYADAAEWDWPGAQKEFRRALELNPGYVVALYQYGFVLSMLGQQDEAISLMQQALAADPLSPIVMYRTGRVYYQARRYDKALEQFERILELNPTDQLGLYGLGLVRAAQGHFDEAITYLQRENLQRGLDLASAMAATGKKSEARRRLAEAIRREENSYLRPGWVAEVYASLGDKDQALRWLERGYHERDAWLALLKVWPPFDPLRSDPRFQDLLRRMNLLN